MDNQANYYPEVAQRLKEYLQATFGQFFKAYFDGDPEEIPTSLMPCLIVEDMTSQHTTTNAPTGCDLVFSTVMVKVVLDKRDDFGASPDTDMTKKKLRRIVAGRDATTGQYLPSTIMGALRPNITLGGAVVQNSNEVQYSADLRSTDIVTSEAWITVTTKEIVQLPVRS